MFLESEVVRACAHSSPATAFALRCAVKVHGFAFAVLYGVGVDDFVPTTPDDVHAVEAAMWATGSSESHPLPFLPTELTASLWLSDT